MKDYQRIVAAIIIGCSIVIAGVVISRAIQEASGIVGSQIASAIANLQIN